MTHDGERERETTRGLTGSVEDTRGAAPKTERRRSKRSKAEKYAEAVRSGKTTGLPARQYSRETFAEGNVVPATHGAWVERYTDPVARELVEGVVAQVSYLGEPSYASAIWAWARNEARIILITKWIDEHGPLDENGNPRPALNSLREFERLAQTHRSRLGLDPLSRAQLGRDVAAQQVDLARLFAEMGDE